MPPLKAKKGGKRGKSGKGRSKSKEKNMDIEVDSNKDKGEGSKGSDNKLSQRKKLSNRRKK
jgi:hypothetical protein